MGSEVEHKIPVIDLSEEKDLKPGSDSCVLACKKVRYAMEEYGCFEIVCDKFPPELRNSIFGAAKDLFDLPKETKMKKITDRPSALGYVAEHPKHPRYETLGINNGVFDSIKESSFHILQFFKYRTPQSDESDLSLGLSAHKDSAHITIIHQHHVGGLRIKTKDGQWIFDVKHSSSSFVVLAGYVLMAWCNDRIFACEHQVSIRDQNETRYSVGLITYTKGILNVPEELVDDKHPLRYKPIDSFGFKIFRLSEEGSKSACL
ncbi:1-aminocyclopropane-1-carboxylate oxidase-3-like protein [Morus notabilis]|uniref:1-aminocyclopropane-1-carboxylate oxidase-3-like protein n=1 Tax=Morus notabilis TaxID=981085 RepID=W9SFJ0_9ROSA|nr:probable inactive 2-oxoglutarate-dependent dioxygenase AOP2 [Morus notabilis]EXC25835.1 1-aminocyclopropane-1-carboxylate oxidase-3-like protein [Morus notabilis]